MTETCAVQQGELRNVALGKLATASHFPKPEQTPPMAVDGDLQSFWTSGEGTPNHWWMVDLGQAYPLEQLVLVWEYGGVPYQYYVEVSSDGVEFERAIDRTSNTDGFGTFVHDFPDATCARFVRITKVDLTGYWMHLFEVEVLVFGPN